MSRKREDVSWKEEEGNKKTDGGVAVAGKGKEVSRNVT